MGKGGSKISIGGGSHPKDFNPEYDYRTKNLKRMKDSYKTLKDSLHKAMANMEGTPQRLKEVGSGYSAVTACLNYGGGGSMSRRDSAVDPETSMPHARMDRDLADESLQASKKFCDAMETLSTTVFPKYRGDLQAKVANELDKVIALNTRTMAQSKKTGDSMAKYVAARKTVAGMEKANAKKGKDLTVDKKYIKAVGDRDTKEKVYQAELQRFDEQYEDMMAEAQKFASESTEVFLDAVVGYYREMVETIDFTETPTRSRTRNRSVANYGEAPLEPTEPTFHAEDSSPNCGGKTLD